MGWRVKQCKWWLLLLLMWVLLSVPLGAEAVGRVALVIGNSGYAERPLRNPPNDARAMTALLRKLGFTVIEKTDLNLSGFRQQVNAFLDQSKGADLRLFYYSGHGASYDGDNYLLPIGHGVTRKHELPDQAYSLKTLLRGLKDQGGINLVLLDSCRDAPFGDAKSIWDDSKGMKPIQPQEGVLIGYAAQNGRTASDNSGGGNSLYTKYLLQELGQSLELREALMRVRQAVYDESRGEQRPTMEDEVLGKVHLAGESEDVRELESHPIAALEITYRRDEIDKSCKVFLSGKLIFSIDCEYSYPIKLIGDFKFSHGKFSQVLVFQEMPMGNACNGGPLYFIEIQVNGNYKVSEPLDFCGGEDPIVELESDSVIVTFPESASNHGVLGQRNRLAEQWRYSNGEFKKFIKVR